MLKDWLQTVCLISSKYNPTSLAKKLVSTNDCGSIFNSRLVEWCENHFLKFSVVQDADDADSFEQISRSSSTAMIKGSPVDCYSTKHPGEQWSWYLTSTHPPSAKRADRHFVQIMWLNFPQSFIESCPLVDLIFLLWGNLAVRNRNQLPGKIIGTRLIYWADINNRQVVRKAPWSSASSDLPQFVPLPSGWRYESPGWANGVNIPLFQVP